MAGKANLRLALRARRDGMSAGQRENKSQRAAAMALPKLQGHGTVAVYQALGSELDPAFLVRQLRAHGTTLVYPRVHGASRVLDFCPVLDPLALRPGGFGVLEPAPDAESIPLARIDAFLIPALSFDHEGNRLGWGKGHYDHTLAQNSHALRVGICFQEQIEASLPVAPTDQPMDWVVTDAKTYAGRVGSNALRPKDEP